ncbi:hypothetical protein D3C76_1482280 [compost metagenome]
MAVVVTLERCAQDLFRLDLGTQLSQLLGVGKHQLRLLTLRRSQLLPGAFERLQSDSSVCFLMRRQGQVLAPGAALQLAQFSRWQDFILAQLGQQSNHCRPIAPLLMQTLQLAQDLYVTRVTLAHRLQG